MLLTESDEQNANIYVAVVDDDESICTSLSRLLRAGLTSRQMLNLEPVKWMCRRTTRIRGDKNYDFDIFGA